MTDEERRRNIERRRAEGRRNRVSRDNTSGSSREGVRRTQLGSEGTDRVRSSSARRDYARRTQEGAGSTRSSSQDNMRRRSARASEDRSRTRRNPEMRDETSRSGAAATPTIHTKSKKRKKGNSGRVLFIVELVVLLFLVLGIFAYAKLNAGLRNIGNNTAEAAEPNETTESMEVIAAEDADGDAAMENEEVAANTNLHGYTNIALIGIDSRDGGMDYANSDVMIIASINNDTGKVRLVSVYRDTYLNTDPENPEGYFMKANHAYCVGSAKRFLSMLNMNFDLDIHDYVVVDFKAVTVLAEDLGGIDLDLTYQEAVHVNNYCIETSSVTGIPYTPLDIDPNNAYEGTQNFHLDGTQTVAYARIRYTAGNDFKRTQRQRLVIEKLVDKAKSHGFTAVTSVINDVFPLCKTSFTNAEIIQLASNVFNYEIEKTTGFPFVLLPTMLGNLDPIIPVTLEQNVIELHAFLFDEENYQVSANVKAYSDRIAAESGFDMSWYDTAKENSVIADNGGAADNVI